MKLKQFHEAVEVELLSEGIKFTNKEINKVKKNSNKIMVGFEFEFNADNNKVSEFIESGKVTPRDPKKVAEENPREEWDMDDVYDTEEYMDARNRLEEEAMDELMEERKNQFESEMEDDINEEYEEAITFLDHMGRSVSHGFHVDTAIGYLADAFSHTVRGDMHEKVRKYLETGNKDLLPQPSLLREYMRIPTYADKAYDYLSDGQQDNIFEVFDQVDSDVVFDEYYTTMKDHYQVGHASIIKYLTTEAFSQAKEFLENFSQMEIDDVVPVIKYTDDLFPSKGQQLNLDFNTFDKNLQLTYDYIEEQLMRGDDMFGIDMLKEGSEILRTILNMIKREGFQYTQDQAIEDYIESEWQEAEEGIREEYWQNGVESYYDSVDMHEIITQIQQNQNVIVLDDEGEPYIEPDEWDGTSTGVHTGATSMKQFMLDYGKHWGLDFNRDFHSQVDTEGHGMVEFKSKPKFLNDSLELMHKMFNFINDIGSTASGHAGLHTNMSLINAKFNVQNFNAGKLVALADVKMLHEFFPVRGHVADMSDVWNAENIFNIARPSNNSNDILKWFDSLISHNTKFQTMNFQHMSANINNRRIEFRAIGGKDYSDREKVIVWNVYRLAYVLEATFDEKFMHKEYLKAVMDTLNDKTRKFYKHFKVKDYLHLRELRKKNPKIETSDEFAYEATKGDVKGL